ncbi:MAG TPA: WD40 repeat domain-containing protein [Spirochaetota bacterium]|nr:WD40 repeat domain-containing protein [Spirochaetota bacterium]
MPLHCRQCAGTDLEQVSPDEFRCRYCGTITFIEPTIEEAERRRAERTASARKSRHPVRLALAVIFGGIIIFLLGSVAATWIKLRTLDADEIKRLGSLAGGHVRILPAVAGLFMDDPPHVIDRNGITALCLSADGKTLYSGAHDDMIAWNVESGGIIKQIHFREWGFLYGSAVAIVHLPKRREIAVLFHSTDSHVLFLDERTLAENARTVSNDSILHITARPDDRVVALVLERRSDAEYSFRLGVGTVGTKGMILRHRSESYPHTQMGAVLHPFGSLYAAFAPDGETIIVRSATDGEEMFCVRHQNDNRRYLAFSASGKHFIYTNNDSLIIRDISDFTIIADIPLDQTFYDFDMRCSVSDDGARAFFFDWSTRTITVRRLPGGAMLPPVRGSGLFSTAIFTPDGKTLITGGTDQLIRFWRAP